MKRSTRHRTRSRAPARRIAEPAGQFPTRDQVAQAKSKLDELITIVRALRRTLDSIPTADGRQWVASGRSGHVRAVHQVQGARQLCDLINSWL